MKKISFYFSLLLIFVPFLFLTSCGLFDTESNGVSPNLVKLSNSGVLGNDKNPILDCSQMFLDKTASATNKNVWTYNFVTNIEYNTLINNDNNYIISAYDTWDAAFSNSDATVYADIMQYDEIDGNSIGKKLNNTSKDGINKKSAILSFNAVKLDNLARYDLKNKNTKNNLERNTSDECENDYMKYFFCQEHVYLYSELDEDSSSEYVLWSTGLGENSVPHELVPTLEKHTSKRGNSIKRQETLKYDPGLARNYISKFNISVPHTNNIYSHWQMAVYGEGSYYRSNGILKPIWFNNDRELSCDYDGTDAWIIESSSDSKYDYDFYYDYKITRTFTAFGKENVSAEATIKLRYFCYDKGRAF